MQKINLSIIEKLINQNVTGKEVDFLIHIARFQDDTGYVTGVYYKDICKQIGSSHQAFYDIKNSLIEKGIIWCTKLNYFDWEIRILDNDFSYYTNEDYKSGKVKYINVNHNLFKQKNFLKLKAKEKLMAIHFLNFNLINNRVHEIGVNRLLDKYADLFQVKKKAVRSYLTMLRLFFSIGIKDHKYYITVRKYMTEKAEEESKAYQGNQIGVALRRNKIKEVKQKDYKDIVRILNIYRSDIKQAEQLQSFSFSRIIAKSLEIINENIKNRTKWKQVIRPALINKLMKEEFRMA